MRRTLALTMLVAVAAAATGCPRNPSGSGPATGGVLQGERYVVLDTRTDQFDFPKAKALAEDAITRYPDLGCMVGLFAYNPPKCLDAVREAGKLGRIRIVAFDEADESLDAIAAGEIHGTVVQHPFKYGYESIRILAGLARGDRSVLPEGGFLNIPPRKITRENVAAFRAELDALKRADARDPGADRPAATDSARPALAYVTTGIASFWVIAEQGARAAARDCNVELLVRMPPEGAADQKRMVQDLLARGVDGIAISPIDPDNQQDMLDEIAERTLLITQDSDAPKSKRLCYVGTDNYTAGRMCGQLVKEAMPEGGSVMIFVGRLDQLNAKLRRQGVIDELLDRDHNPQRYDRP